MRLCLSEAGRLRGVEGLRTRHKQGRFVELFPLTRRRDGAKLGDAMGTGLSSPVPDEPIYALKVAVEAIPMTSIGALYQFLSAHKEEFPPLYYGRGRKARRMLTKTEIAKIRCMIYTTDDVYATRRLGRRPGRHYNLIEAIIARASA
jgi:hypothetical protein